jgi:hypothetical protein
MWFCPQFANLDVWLAGRTPCFSHGEELAGAGQWPLSVGKCDLQFAETCTPHLQIICCRPQRPGYSDAQPGGHSMDLDPT